MWRSATGDQAMTKEPAAKRGRSRHLETLRSRINLADATRVALAIVAVLALVAVLWLARSAVLLLFAGILLAVLLDGLSRPFVRWTDMPKAAALLIVVVAIGVFFGLVAWSAGPVVAQQLQELGQNLGQAISSFGQKAASQADQSGLIDKLNWTELIGMMPSPLGIATGATAVAGTIVGAVTSLLIVTFFGIYFALDPGLYTRFILRAVPLEHRDEARDLLREIGAVLHRWLNGQLLAMAAVGTITYIGLVLLGMPVPVALALLVGLFEFIPYLGPVLGAIPMLLIAGAQGLEMVLWVAGLYLLVQLLEGYILTPLIQSRAVSMQPAVVITSQLVFGALFGVLGLALATPLAAAASVPLRHYLGTGER
jgi:predicted PurR-regulated permease PerM